MLSKWDMINELLFTYHKLFQSEIIGKETGSSKWYPFLSVLKGKLQNTFIVNEFASINFESV